MKYAKKILSALSPFITFVILFGLMEFAVRFFKIPVYILPSPIDSFKYIFTDFDEIKIHVFKTLKSFLVGYPVGSLIGISLA